MVESSDNMRPVTIRRCRRAYTMMRDNNSSLGAAAKAVGTTARTLKKYFQATTFVWPNGEGIGFRSRGLQVRVLHFLKDNQ